MAICTEDAREWRGFEKPRLAFASRPRQCVRQEFVSTPVQALTMLIAGPTKLNKIVESAL
jgi:hypothetical protein